jgi:hypothetical protein
MTGTIFSANDVSGIPSIEVLDTGLVKLAQYSGNVLLGSGTDNGAKLQVTGSTTITSATDSFLTLNKSSGTAWNYINFSQAGTRRFYFGINASSEPELGTDNSSVFRVLGGMSIAGSVALHAGNYTSYSPSLTGSGASGSWSINAATASRVTGGNLDPASTAFNNALVATSGSNRVVAFDGNGNTPSVWWTNGTRAYGAIDAQDPGLTFWANNGSNWQQQIALGYGTVNINTTLQQGGNQVLHAGNHKTYRGTQLVSPNADTVVAADSAMPDAPNSFIHTLGLGPSGDDGHILGMTWVSIYGYGPQIWLDTDPTNRMAIRSRDSSGNWTAWWEVLTSGNYSNYAQPLLVSGTNIKTINGSSLLGSGDITVSGGGGGTSFGKVLVFAR